MIYKSAKSVREGTLVVDADDVFADEHFDSVRKLDGTVMTP